MTDHLNRHNIYPSQCPEPMRAAPRTGSRGGCEHCNGTYEQKPLYHANNYEPYTCMQSSIEILESADGKHTIEVDIWQDGNAYASFEITHCPKCGRKLESEVKG